MSSVFAFFHHLFPATGATRLAQVHFRLTAASGIAHLAGLYFIHGAATP